MENKNRYVVLKQGDATLVIDKIGAQIVSYKINGVELMYQGALDPSNHKWKKTAPVLFPNAGPMVSEAKFQRRDKNGNLMRTESGEPVMDSQSLRQVVVAEAADGTTKEFFVKELKLDGKKQLVYVDRYGNALDGVEINTGVNGETLITVLAENKTYTVDKKPTVFTEYVHNGGYYYMTQHGFIQSTYFRTMGRSSNHCVLGTSSNDTTTSEYPWQFNFAAVYGLGENGELEATFAAVNKDKSSMIGGIGWHPAFSLHDEPQKYKLVLTNIKGSPVYDDKTKGKFAVSEGEELDINELVVSPKVSGKIMGIEECDLKLLYYPHDGAEPIEYLSMHMSEPNAILWSAEDNMIALEPWTTVPRQVGRVKNQHEIEELTDAPLIKPGETKEMTAKVSINPDYLQMIKQTQVEAGKKIRK